MTDEGGVLENLPRSRPGQRSSKRSATPNQAAKPPAEAKKAKPANKPKPSTASAKPAAEKPPPVREEAESAGSNPVGEVVRSVSSLAGGGARAARDVAREVLRRLPRP
jgi:hypothetical protein